MAHERIPTESNSLYLEISRPASSVGSKRETLRTAAIETIDNDVSPLLLSGTLVGH
jgi:hypothetical protein